MDMSAGFFISFFCGGGDVKSVSVCNHQGNMSNKKTSLDQYHEMMNHLILYLVSLKRGGLSFSINPYIITPTIPGYEHSVVLFHINNLKKGSKKLF